MLRPQTGVYHTVTLHIKWAATLYRKSAFFASWDLSNRWLVFSFPVIMVLLFPSTATLADITYEIGCAVELAKSPLLWSTCQGGRGCQHLGWFGPAVLTWHAAEEGNPKILLVRLSCTSAWSMTKWSWYNRSLIRWPKLKLSPLLLVELPDRLLLLATKILLFSWLHCLVVAKISNTWMLFLPI